MLLFHAPSRLPRTRLTMTVALVTFCFGVCILQLRSYSRILIDKSEMVKIVPHRNVNQSLLHLEGSSTTAVRKPPPKIEDLKYDVDTVPQNSLEGEKWDKLGVLNGPPTEFFRGNLRNDTYYLTSWSNAGFTNEFMNYVNMIYLATLTDRVPIIPPFAPDHHISSSAGIVPFGDVFDLDALRDQLRMHILEWRDVKSLPTSSDPDPYPYSARPGTPEFRSEPLGCWSTRKMTGKEPIQAENVVHHIGVDASYTRVPSFTRFSQDPDDPHVVFSRLAALIYRSPSFSSISRNHIVPGWAHYHDPEKEPDKFEDLAPSPGGHHKKPEGQLACFDTMYYVTSGVEAFEWRFGFSPVWRTVGRWVRFSARIKGLAKEYMKELFGGDQGGHEEYDASVPPFIAVHIRRGDFSIFCGKGDCYPQLSVYQKHVEDVKRELLESKGIDVKHVVLMSDETSPAFWDEVTVGLGWLHVNHSAHRTLERLGEWYLPIIDVVVQSYAVGLVGTEDSTFSLVSQKRVVDWNDGIIRSVNVASGT